jgi:general secretion pathway protein F/type IV pilus assembly protein PilC
MPEFTYQAMGSTGLRSAGTLTANTEREVVAILDARGLFPLKVEQAKGSRGAAKGWSGKKVKGRVMATFYSQLADLLKAGVPLLRSLDILERQSAAPALSEVIREVRAKVADGTTLGDSMAPYPRVFSELAVSMVRAGQEGGFLEDVLKRIADFTENQEDLKSKVVGAMAYPIFLATVGFIVINVLVIFFVPMFEPIFDKLTEKGELPTVTQLVVGTSHFLQRYGLFFVVGVVAGFYALRRWTRTDNGRRIIDAFKLKVPGAGPIFLSLALTRFTRILGTMLHNGIPILQALRISKDSTGNKVLSDAIDKAADNITSGHSLATPLTACKYFPRDVCEMVAVGEESNNLENVLLGVADALEKRTTRQLELFVRLLEPMMLLVMASITMVVVVGLLVPVFKMSSVVT